MDNEVEIEAEVIKNIINKGEISIGKVKVKMISYYRTQQFHLQMSQII